MKITSQIILAASFLVLVSCTDEKKANTTQGVGTTPVNFSTPGAQQSTTTAAGQNPAHGQPGHRCDIPVGAALNTPAQSTSTAPAGITPTPITTPVTSNAVAPGTNPAHGQPGHDCAVPVGAPLNK